MNIVCLFELELELEQVLGLKFYFCLEFSQFCWEFILLKFHPLASTTAKSPEAPPVFFKTAYNKLSLDSSTLLQDNTNCQFCYIRRYSVTPDGCGITEDQSQNRHK